MPLPPRFWLLKLSTSILLIYPRWVMAITVSSSGIRSSMDTSSSYPMAVRLSSPYLSAIIWISSLITVRSFFTSARIACNSSILARSSLYSFSSFSRSKPVSARSLMSTMAWDCASDKPKRSINWFLASATLDEPRIIRMTSSMWSRAMSRPFKIWARSSALFRSYCVLLLTTSSWCFRYSSSI